MLPNRLIVCDQLYIAMSDSVTVWNLQLESNSEINKNWISDVNLNVIKALKKLKL